MPAIGFFGKMPLVGDFVGRGFSAELRERLDHVLQVALSSATADGIDLRQLMFSAPPVMISVRPGALGDTGFSGLCLPSCDRVGRGFPLCVGMETDAQALPLPLLWPSAALTRKLCHNVAGTLQAGGGADDLLACLPTGGDWIRLAATGLPFSDMADDTVPSIPSDAKNIWLNGPEQSMSLSSRALCSRLAFTAELVGTVVRDDGAAEAFFCSRNLDSWSSLAALFDRRWEHWGWTTYQLPTSEPSNGH